MGRVPCGQNVAGRDWPPVCGFVALEGDDALDLDEGALGKCAHLHGAAGGVGLGEATAVDLVHCVEIGDVCEEDGGLHHVVEGGASGGEQGLDVLECLLGLRDHAVRQLAGHRVETQLAGKEGEVAGGNTGGVGAEGRGCLLGCDDVLVHEFLLLLSVGGIADG